MNLSPFFPTNLQAISSTEADSTWKRSFFRVKVVSRNLMSSFSLVKHAILLFSHHYSLERFTGMEKFKKYEGKQTLLMFSQINMANYVTAHASAWYYWLFSDDSTRGGCACKTSTSPLQPSFPLAQTRGSHRKDSLMELDILFVSHWPPALHARVCW